MQGSILYGRHSLVKREIFSAYDMRYLILLRFKVTEVALMMDWEDSTGGSASEDEIDDIHNLHKAVSNLRENGTGSTRGSMRGLQRAVTEGWLITRAREMCSFSHDRYRQAAQAEAEALPQDVKTKMSFRVRAVIAARQNAYHVALTDYSHDAARIPGRRLPGR